MTIRTYNNSLPDSAVVDIEDMPRQTALELMEALTVTMRIAPHQFEAVGDLLGQLRDALGQERPKWKM
jgi:hypothetical protein